jgi:hypothetical protein
MKTNSAKLICILEDGQIGRNIYIYNKEKRKRRQANVDGGKYIKANCSQCNRMLQYKTNSVASVRNRTMPTERPLLVSEVSANGFADRRCHVVSMTDPYDRILGFLDRRRYYK